MGLLDDHLITREVKRTIDTKQWGTLFSYLSLYVAIIHFPFFPFYMKGLLPGMIEYLLWGIWLLGIGGILLLSFSIGVLSLIFFLVIMGYIVLVPIFKYFVSFFADISLWTNETWLWYFSWFLTGIFMLVPLAFILFILAPSGEEDRIK